MVGLNNRVESAECYKPTFYDGRGKKMNFFLPFCCDLEKVIYICTPHSSSNQAGSSSEEKFKNLQIEFGKNKKAFIFAIRFENKVSQYT